MDIYPDFGAFGDNTTIQTVIGALLTFVLVTAVLTMLISPALPGRSLPPTATTPLLPKRTPGSSPPSNKPPSKPTANPDSSPDNKSKPSLPQPYHSAVKSERDLRWAKSTSV